MRLRRTPARIRIEGDALDGAKAISGQRLPLETGGILLGWRDVDCIHVARFIEVRDPNAQRVAYERNHDIAQAALTAAKAALPPTSLLGYVGEWHTHPALQPPSRQDRKELKALARLSTSPVAMIVLRSSGDEWHPYALTATGRAIGATVLTFEET